jgi:hypothetical protein
MSFISWLLDWTSIHAPRSRAQRQAAAPRCQLQLEVLEGRDVPSTLTVTTASGNFVPGSLPYEIAAAQSGDTIVFAKSLSGQTIGVTTVIDKDLDIEGLGASKLTLSGFGNRVFEVSAGVQVTLANLTITGGVSPFNSGFGDPYSGIGGAILNFGTLTLRGCTLSGNGAVVGGAIANEFGGTLTVSGCLLSGNNANAKGGAIYNAGTLTLSGSTVTKNSTNGGGEGGGVFNDYGGILTILSSTVKGNHAPVGIDLYNLGSWSADSSSTIGKIGP